MLEEHKDLYKSDRSRENVTPENAVKESYSISPNSVSCISIVFKESDGFP